MLSVRKGGVRAASSKCRCYLYSQINDVGAAEPSFFRAGARLCDRLRLLLIGSRKKRLLKKKFHKKIYNYLVGYALACLILTFLQPLTQLSRLLVMISNFWNFVICITVAAENRSRIWLRTFLEARSRGRPKKAVLLNNTTGTTVIKKYV